jgi:hypothetical protein
MEEEKCDGKMASPKINLKNWFKKHTVFLRSSLKTMRKYV